MSPIACDASEAKYGRAFFLYVMRIGMKAVMATIMLCVGPLWVSGGMMMSMSGSEDMIQTSIMLYSVCVIFWVALAAKYPSAACPSGYIVGAYGCCLI